MIALYHIWWSPGNELNIFYTSNPSSLRTPVGHFLQWDMGIGISLKLTTQTSSDLKTDAWERDSSKWASTFDHPFTNETIWPRDLTCSSSGEFVYIKFVYSSTVTGNGDFPQPGMPFFEEMVSSLCMIIPSTRCCAGDLRVGLVLPFACPAISNGDCEGGPVTTSICPFKRSLFRFLRLFLAPHLCF